MIKQYPSNKSISPSLLSSEQIALRKKINKPDPKIKRKRCNACGRIHPISNFYWKGARLGSNGYWRRGNYANQCKDCELKRAGVLEIGKYRFAGDILKKGFRKCTICKDIKPLKHFCKSKNSLGGHSHNCRECMHFHNKKYTKRRMGERETMQLPYIIRYGKYHGIKRFTKKTITKLRLEIEDKRKPKYFLDNKFFITGNEFARYVKKQYGILATCVTQRLAKGYTERQCTMSEHDFRSMVLNIIYEKRKPKYFLDGKGFPTASAFCRYASKAYGISETCIRQRLDGGCNEKQCISKGKVKVTDLITGKIFLFDNTKNTELLKMFPYDYVIRHIVSGSPTPNYNIKKSGSGRVVTRNIHKNPCIIQKV